MLQGEQKVRCMAIGCKLCMKLCLYNYLAYLTCSYPLYHGRSSEIDRFGKILNRIGLTNSKYNNIVDAKSLTLTNRGLAIRIILTSLQCTPETKR